MKQLLMIFVVALSLIGFGCDSKDNDFCDGDVVAQATYTIQTIDQYEQTLSAKFTIDQADHACVTADARLFLSGIVNNASLQREILVRPGEYVYSIDPIHVSGTISNEALQTFYFEYRLPGVIGEGEKYYLRQ